MLGGPYLDVIAGVTKVKNMNKVLYDKGSEYFVRDALGIKEEKQEEVFGYVKEDGKVKELKSFSELLEYVL